MKSVWTRVNFPYMLLTFSGRDNIRINFHADKFEVCTGRLCKYGVKHPAVHSLLWSKITTIKLRWLIYIVNYEPTILSLVNKTCYIRHMPFSQTIVAKSMVGRFVLCQCQTNVRLVLKPNLMIKISFKIPFTDFDWTSKAAFVSRVKNVDQHLGNNWITCFSI